MRKLLFIVILIFVITAGATFAAIQINKTNNGGFMKDKKNLIAYFSWSGNTKSIAEKIHSQVGGDMFRIETAAPYPEDYNETAYGVAKDQHEKNIHPELKNNGNVSNYDVIFLGTPAWWYTMAPAVKTFLESNNFEEKTIVPFITHGGGGKYTIKEDIEGLTPGAKVLEPLVIYGKGNAQTDKEIVDWLKNNQ